MAQYLIKRLLLMIPTLFGIMLLNFVIIQAAPGGPVERMMSIVKNHSTEAIGRISGTDETLQQGAMEYRGAQGLEEQLIEQLTQQFGFDKPAHERFWLMIKNCLTFDFGKSFYRDDVSVLELIADKLPVSISLGVWATLFTYLISIPLGIRKAVKDGSRFDVVTSFIIVIGNAIPAFLFAILFIVLFAGGTFWNIFPLRGIVSENWSELSTFQQILDYAWHMALPVLALLIGSFASLTLLTKNSFLDEIHKQYVLTAKAKGLSDKRVFYGHVFRNAMLIVIASFPGALIGMLFTGSLLIEVVFSLDGLGLLGYEAAINRDYPVVFASLYIFTLIGLVLNLVGDLTYRLVDPRIDFEKRG